MQASESVYGYLVAYVGVWARVCLCHLLVLHTCLPDALYANVFRAHSAREYSPTSSESRSLRLIKENALWASDSRYSPLPPRCHPFSADNNYLRGERTNDDLDQTKMKGAASPLIDLATTVTGINFRGAVSTSLTIDRHLIIRFIFSSIIQLYPGMGLFLLAFVDMDDMD